ncbi:MAG: acylphosphatase [Armatimonadota bacterium]|nr:acylphosphatase [Armatimonadota bacterium]MDR7519441.1 acylphosphatase [Armatimonadota bacterium]MDR7549879.1 acylphosphatase [Armatimonadota bacterium]
MPGNPGRPPGPDRVRAHLWIKGRVQGVGFRFFVHRRASALGTAGFVRNLADGRVEVVAEGSPEAVAALIDDVRAGPPGARVQDVEVTWEAPRGEGGFAIRTDGRR